MTLKGIIDNIKYTIVHYCFYAHDRKVGVLIMKKKAFFVVLLSLILFLISSCGDTSDKDSNLTKIDTGLLMCTFMSGDYTSGEIYLVGATAVNSEMPETEIVTLNTKDFEITKVEHKVTDGLFAPSIYPDSNGGYWIFEMDPYGEIIVLKRYFNGKFELEVDLTNFVNKYPRRNFDGDSYDFHMCGCLSNGSIVINERETVFLIDKTGRCTDSWQLPESKSISDIDRVHVSKDDIFFIRGSVEENSTKIYSLRENGDIEVLYELESFYADSFVGADGQCYLVGSDNGSLYKLQKNGDVLFICSWEELRPSGSLMNAVALSDNAIFLNISNDVFLVGETQHQMKTDESEKTELTLACYGEQPYVKQKVNEFNSENDDFRIEIIDYSHYSDGITKMNLDITTGSAPDIIFWDSTLKSLLEQEIYLNKGVLLDLYEFLNNDTDTKDVIFSNILKALESSSGALYELPLEFYMSVVVGKQSAVGMKLGWTPDEFITFLEDYPDAKIPFGNADWDLLLSLYVANNFKTLIDFDKQQCFFDTDEFINVMQIFENHKSLKSDESVLDAILINEGQQLLNYNTLGDVSSIQKFKKLFNDDITFVGFPTSEGVGNAFVVPGSLSISAMSAYPDICWEFLKEFIGYDEQLRSCDFFPVNNDALAERLNNPTLYEESAVLTHKDTQGNTWSVAFTDATPEESKQVCELIESCDRVFRENNSIMEIILDEASAFYYGSKSVDDVVKNIQTRVQLYINEHG